MERADFGMAAYCLMLSTLNMLEEKKLINREEANIIVQKAAVSVEQTTMMLKKPDIMFAAEILHGIYGISDKQK